MSATDELRRLLDERGVEWNDMSAHLPTGMLWCTEWTSQDGEPCTAIEGADDIPDGKLSVQALLTPAQAIAATLGRGTLTAEQVSRATYAHSIHADCADADWQAIADELNVTLGSEDTYTREDVEGAFVSGYSLGLDMFDSSKTEKGWNQNERNLDEEMEDLGWVRKDAAKLGAETCEMEYVSDWMGWHCKSCDNLRQGLPDQKPKYCPNCGRKVVDE